MKPRLIILVRHGESEANRNWNINISMPNHIIPLTSHGVEQAHQCGLGVRRLLKPKEKVIMLQSPYTRTRQTADGIYNAITNPVLDPEEAAASNNELTSGETVWSNIERMEDPRLREQDFGNFQEEESMRSILRDRESYGWFFYRIPHGESPADVFDRCSSFCETLFRRFETHAPDVVILVSHGIWCRVFMMRYFHWPYEEFERLSNLPNATPVVMELQENGRYELTRELHRWC